jgi:hypothetical protein
MPAPAASRAAARNLRRLRILASLQAGLSYAAIGRAEELSRGRLLAKLNTMAERMIAARKSGLVDADGRPCQQDGEAALDATDSPDFVDDPAAPSSAGLDAA